MGNCISSAITNCRSRPRSNPTDKLARRSSNGAATRHRQRPHGSDSTTQPHSTSHGNPEVELEPLPPAPLRFTPQMLLDINPYGYTTDPAPDGNYTIRYTAQTPPYLLAKLRVSPDGRFLIVRHIDTANHPHRHRPYASDVLLSFWEWHRGGKRDLMGGVVFEFVVENSMKEVTPYVYSALGGRRMLGGVLSVSCPDGEGNEKPEARLFQYICERSNLVRLAGRVCGTDRGIERIDFESWEYEEHGANPPDPYNLRVTFD